MGVTRAASRLWASTSAFSRSFSRDVRSNALSNASFDAEASGFAMVAAQTSLYFSNVDGFDGTRSAYSYQASHLGM